MVTQTKTLWWEAELERTARPIEGEDALTLIFAPQDRKTFMYALRGLAAIPNTDADAYDFVLSMSAVEMTASPRGLIMASCDGHRLFICEVDGKWHGQAGLLGREAQNMGGMMVSAVDAKKMATALNKYKARDDGHLTFNFKTDGKATVDLWRHNKTYYGRRTGEERVVVRGDAIPGVYRYWKTILTEALEDPCFEPAILSPAYLAAMGKALGGLDAWRHEVFASRMSKKGVCLFERYGDSARGLYAIMPININISIEKDLEHYRYYTKEEDANG